MMKLQEVVIYAQNPFTNNLMSGMKRKAMLEYDEDGVIEAVYTASPKLDGPKDDTGSGVVVTRKPVLYMVKEDETISVAVSTFNSESTQEVCTTAEFNEKYAGLPVTM